MKKKVKLATESVESRASISTNPLQTIIRLAVVLVVLAAIPATTMIALAHPPTDPLHGAVLAWV